MNANTENRPRRPEPRRHVANGIRSLRIAAAATGPAPSHEQRS
jgi:hypothetical protein